MTMDKKYPSKKDLTALCSRMFPASQLTYNWTGAGVTMRGFYTGSGSDNRSPGGSQQTGTASQTDKVERQEKC